MSYKGITLQQIECFLAVAKYQSFTEAAKKTYISQSSLSRQIASMENLLGISLFYRTKRCIRLTAEGATLYSDLDGVTDRINNALKACDKPQLNDERILRIGCFEAMDLGVFLQVVLMGFKAEYMNVQLIIERHGFKVLKEKLSKKELDVIFTLSFEVEHETDFLWEDVFRQQSCILMARDHPLASKSVEDLTAFSEETFIVLSREISPMGYDGIINACQSAGFTPKRMIEMPNLESVLLTVENGSGVTLVDENLRLSRKENFKLCNVKNDFNYVVMAVNKDDVKQEVLFFENYIRDKNQTFDSHVQ